jgi:hypothetical protein
MSQTADVMKSELNKLRSDLCAAFQTPGNQDQDGSSLGAAQNAAAAAVKELVVEIERLVQHMENIDKQMAEVWHLHEHMQARHIGETLPAASPQFHALSINVITMSEAV